MKKGYKNKYLKKEAKKTLQSWHKWHDEDEEDGDEALISLSVLPLTRPELTLQESGDVLQLWDVVLPVAAVFLQQGEDPIVLAAGVSRVQGLQLLEHCAPCGLLLFCVLHSGDGLATGDKDMRVVVLLSVSLYLKINIKYIFKNVIYWFTTETVKSDK